MSPETSTPLRILVTGASGFVGQTLCLSLLERGFLVRACLQDGQEPAQLARLRGPLEFHCLGDLDANPHWGKALRGIDTIIHLAARVHVMEDRAKDPLAEFRRTNTLATQRLAEAASGVVRRLIFVSTIKVNGERTLDKPFDEQDPPQPADPYAVSKWEAEEKLRNVAAGSGLEVVIVRPPLVYGPRVRANFLRLMHAVYRGLPLPMGCFDNRRSLIGVRNLANAMIQCVRHPAAANQTFLVGDSEDVSTGELVTRMARALGCPCRLLPLPRFCIRFAARLAGQGAEADRILGSLVLNCRKARERLNWEAPVSLGDGLRETARWYLDVLADTSRDHVA